MAYVTTTEINTFLGTSWEDSLLTLLRDMVESFLHSELRITSFEEQSYTEYHEARDDFYIVKELNPTILTSINDVAASNYLFEGRLLRIKDSYTCDSWGRIKLIYTAGYATVPQDVKTLVLYMVWGAYNARKGIGIKEWTQGQLSVTYSSQQEMDIFNQMFTSLMSKYKKNDIYA